MYVLEKLELIHNCGFEDTNGQLAKYFINQTYKRTNEQIKNVEMNTGISKSSIIRFCQQAGFSGFSDFNDALCQDLVFERSKNQDRKESGTDPKKIKQFCEALHEAKVIYFFGPRMYLEVLKPLIRFLRRDHEVITSMPYNHKAQERMFGSIKENDLVCLAEPEKTWASLREQLQIQTEMCFPLPNWSCRTVFIGKKETERAWLSVPVSNEHSLIEWMEQFTNAMMNEMEDLR